MHAGRSCENEADKRDIVIAIGRGTSVQKGAATRTDEQWRYSE
jgi:hypothetical protein